jgi:Tol biopolymer transport system component
MVTPLPPLTGSGGGVIAFTSDRDGNWEIYVMNADGTDPRRLTMNLLRDHRHAWSPDGRLLAFTSTRKGSEDIFVINVQDVLGGTASSSPLRLTDNPANEWSPAWSPDGTQIVFVTDRDRNSEVYVMNVADVLQGGGGAGSGSSEPWRLTHNRGEDDSPAWSPDGTQIAFVSNRDGNEEIYVMDADGGKQRRLTDNDGDDWFPAWSPDGTQIAFTSERDGNYDIYVMNPDGSDPRRLTNNDADDWQPAWSPDGTQIVFQSNPEAQWDLYVIAVADGADDAGTNQWQLTNHGAADRQPAWRPSLDSMTSMPTPGSTPAGTTWTRPADGMVMVYVPAGEFEMGSDMGELLYALQLCERYGGFCEREDDERPAHAVALDGFWIDKYEVTNAQYRLCVEAGVCKAPTICLWGVSGYDDATKSDHPVVCVEWYGARDYCEWVGARLPTEAEWEYAARGMGGLRFPWGDEFDGTRLNFCDANCPDANTWKAPEYDDGFETTAPVGSFPTGMSWCGVLDMAGNVNEWAADWYAPRYPGTSRQENPTGPEDGTVRVVRGGSWSDTLPSIRGAHRHWHTPDSPGADHGFRCARDAE